MSTPMHTIVVADKCRKCAEIDETVQRVKACLKALSDKVQWRIEGLRQEES